MVEARVAQLEVENLLLKAQIKQYETILKAHGLEMKPQDPSLETSRSKAMKIQIFRDYFKGREDVYAVRFISKDKVGYAPQVASAYRYLTAKARQSIDKKLLYEPLNDAVIEGHLKGHKTIGIYPMLDDQTTYFLAIDFDKSSFKQDAQAVSQVAFKEGFDHLVEVSRSGNGAHLWFFFADQVTAKDARDLAKILLSKTMMEHRSLSLDSYDRLFPAQDYIEANQFGNLIALPLQGKSGMEGLTLFVDEHFEPYQDQYGRLLRTSKIQEEALLDYLKREKQHQAADLVTHNMHAFDLRPVDFSGPLTLIIDGDIIIDKHCLTPRSTQFFKRMAALLNPEYYKKKRQRFSTYTTPRIIELYQEDENTLSVPKGLIGLMIAALEQAHIAYTLIDKRVTPPMKQKLKFKYDLFKSQEALFQNVLNHEQGIIVAPTGFGKTIVAIALMAHRQLKTLIVSHRVTVCKQWRKQLEEQTNINQIGACYDGVDDLGHDVDIATFQTLKKRDIFAMKNDYGLIIIDEVHHLAAYSFEQVIRPLNAQYTYGLTATPNRSDGLEGITKLLISGIIAEETSTEHQLIKKLYPRFTQTMFTMDEDWHTLTQTIVKDEVRNNRIVQDIIKTFHEGKTLLVLTERIEHLENLRLALSSVQAHLFVLHGKLTSKEKQERLEALKQRQEPFILLSTGKYIGEGFDDNRLDTLFITMPFTWRGTLSQYVGRLNRQRQGKHELVVYDYVDIHARVFANMFLKRQRGYKSLGFEIIETEDSRQHFFSSNDYEKTLLEDMRHAEDTVVFYVRYGHAKRIEWLKQQVTIDSHVVQSEVNMIVIDQRIVWYGSLNPFVFKHQRLDSLLRLDNPALAKRLIGEKI